MEELGYVSFKGKSRTTQEVAILQRERTVELAVKDWKKRLKKWRAWLENGREAEANQQIERHQPPLRGCGPGRRTEARTGGGLPQTVH